MPTAHIQTVSDLFPSKWLCADDLAGRAITVTISAVTLEEIRQRNGASELKAVLAFERAHKRLILNKTQALAIAGALCSEVLADWRGQRIQMRAGQAPNGKPTIVISPAQTQNNDPRQPPQAEEKQ